MALKKKEVEQNDNREDPPWLYSIFFVFIIIVLVSKWMKPEEGMATDWPQLATWGIVVDILGFTILAREWRLSIRSPDAIYRATLRELEKEINLWVNIKSNMTEEEANKRKYFDPNFPAEPGEQSVNDTLDGLQQKAAKLLDQGQMGFWLNKRIKNFEIGFSFVLLGFVMQFLSSVMTI